MTCKGLREIRRLRSAGHCYWQEVLLLILSPSIGYSGNCHGRPMIRLHADFIHASSHLCCQGLGPSLIKPSLLNLLSRIKVRLLASYSKRYLSLNRKCRTIESICTLITFDNQNQMVTFGNVYHHQMLGTR